MASDILQKLLDVFIPGITAYEFSSCYDDEAAAARSLIEEFRVPNFCVDRMVDIYVQERKKRKRIAEDSVPDWYVRSSLYKTRKIENQPK